MTFTQLVESATRSTDEIQAILDHIITNSKLMFESAHVYSDGTSDHDIVGLVRHKNDVKSPKRKIKVRSNKNFTPDSFAIKSESLDFTAIRVERNADKAWDDFKDTFVKFLDIELPWVDIEIREDSVPWGNGEYFTIGREENQLKHQFNILPTDRNWESFRRVRNMCNMRRRELKRDYMINSITKYKFDPKKLWATLKKLLPNSKAVQHLSKLEGETDPKKIADIINRYFNSIGPTLASVFTGDRPDGT